MTTPDIPSSIIHYHYPFSPYARRITWYLTLRNIPYAQCIQPYVLPRPDVNALGVQYRRIPLLTIGRDIYCDTRLILQKLEEHFPQHQPNTPYRNLGTISTPEQKALQKLLQRLMIDGGVFARAAQLIPTNGPALQDPKFRKDREGYSGRSWDLKEIERNRPEAVAYMRQAFELLEELLSDGRDWISGTERPSLGDIDAIWPVDWLMGMPGALPEETISEKQFPKVWAWDRRFRAALKEAAGSNVQKKATEVKGEQATRFVGESDFVETVAVDGNDPLRLKEGTTVEVWPIDSGFSHKDRGRLVGLTKDEVVAAVQTKERREVRVHMPRWGFRIREVDSGNARL
ncbi:MAG: hypothetical protein M1820_003053 [Bogoriella megaspora]|nr:MAG: hypothetical protein M1820_003053 [Bogoriella megaspora]